MKPIEEKILDALLLIIARRCRQGETDIKGLQALEMAISDVLTKSGEGEVSEDFREGFADNWLKLILQPLLDADLLELLRLVLNGDPAAINQLILKLSDANFSNAKRLAVTKILSKAFERGKDSAGLVLEKTLENLGKKSELRNELIAYQNAITNTSEYTGKYLNIIEPTFNPRPTLGYAPRRGAKKDDDDK